MSGAIFLIAAAASLAAAGAVLLYILGRRTEYNTVVVARVQSVGVIDAGVRGAIARPAFPSFLRWVLDDLWRAGITPAPWLGWAFGAGVLATALVGGVSSGLIGGVTLAGIFVGAVYLFLLWCARKRRQQIVTQLPVFLDHVIRALSAGNSVESALMTATEPSPDPIRSVFERVIRQTRMGAALDSSLEQTAQLYRLQELDLLSLAVRVNQKYGGKIEATFQNIITMIRQRERARREFAALTGETRISAVVLIAVPLGLAAHMLTVNPDFLYSMWLDPVGWLLLAGAAVLMVIGILIVWRMIKAL
ncbi:MAG: type II secretion system F family protein [Candidatus Binatia bacterium]